MKCKYCGGYTATINAKCYDMINTTYKGHNVNGVPLNSNIDYNGTTLTIEYCTICGKVQHEHQIPESTISHYEVKTEKFVDLLDTFFDHTLNDNLGAANVLLPKIQLYLHNVDLEPFMNAWYQYCDVKHIYPNLPEFMELIKYMRQVYADVIIPAN
jgi:hypothetical protein